MCLEYLKETSEDFQVIGEDSIDEERVQTICLTIVSKMTNPKMTSILASSVYKNETLFHSSICQKFTSLSLSNCIHFSQNLVESFSITVSLAPSLVYRLLELESRFLWRNQVASVPLPEESLCDHVMCLHRTTRSFAFHGSPGSHVREFPLKVFGGERKSRSRNLANFTAATFVLTLRNQRNPETRGDLIKFDKTSWAREQDGRV